MAPLLSRSALLFLALSLFTQRCTAKPGVVELSIEKRQVDPALLAKPLRKRSSTVQSTLYNSLDATLYIINTTVGTPPQNIGLQLDTGSSDIWVPWVKLQACVRGLCTSGAFDPTASSSFVEVARNEFEIAYVDGTEIAGDYVNETFGIGGATIKQLTMAVAKEVNSAGGDQQPLYGIAGISFDAEEAIFQESGGQAEYSNIIHDMVSQGVIQTKAYSLWLNDLDATQGSILFGGVDTAKFNGDLVVLPLQPDTETGIIDSFTVTWAGLEIDGAGGKNVYSVASTAPVILDSGTSLTYLPDDIANAIIGGVGAVEDQELGVLVPCNISNTAGVFKFQFGNSNGPVISAQISQFVIPFPDDLGFTPTINGKAACQWGIQPAGEAPNLFGDTFLRSAYVVYNLDGNQIAIAETNFNTTDSNVEQITAASSIPGATSTATGVAQQTHTGAIFPTDTGFPFGIGTGTSIGFSTSTIGTFDLGTKSSTTSKPSSTSTSSTSAPHKGVASSQRVPSAPFVGTIVAGVTVLFAMLSGSMLIFL